MTYNPLHPGFSTSLLGSIDPVRFFDPNRIESDQLLNPSQYDDSPDLRPKRIHKDTVKHTVVIIIISAIIFIAVVAIYEVFRNIINRHYSRQALYDPEAKNNLDDINRTIIVNNNSLQATLVFAFFCLLTAIIFLPILISIISN